MKYILIIAVCMITACNKNTHPAFEYNRNEKPRMDAFNDRVFFTALREAYSADSSVFLLIEKNDALNPYDGLSAEALLKADECAKDFIRKMPAPAMCEDCKNGKNYFMASILHYYKSRELESIAKKYYKIHLRNSRNG